MKLVYLAIVTLFVSACTTTPTVLPPLTPKKDTVVMPQGLTQECPPLEHLPSQDLTQEQVLELGRSAIKAYGLCRNRYKELLDITAEAFNIKLDGPASAAIAK